MTLEQAHSSRRIRHGGRSVFAGELMALIGACSGTHAPAHLDARIDAFLGAFGKTLEGMPADELEGHREALIAAKTLKDASLHDEADRNWEQISNRTCAARHETPLENYLENFPRRCAWSRSVLPLHAGTQPAWLWPFSQPPFTSLVCMHGGRSSSLRSPTIYICCGHSARLRRSASFGAGTTSWRGRRRWRHCER